jgi:hypothetical protein
MSVNSWQLCRSSRTFAHGVVLSSHWHVEKARAVERGNKVPRSRILQRKVCGDRACSERVSAFLGQWIPSAVSPQVHSLVRMLPFMEKWSSHIGGFPFAACEEKVGVMVGSSLGARLMMSHRNTIGGKVLPSARAARPRCQQSRRPSGSGHAGGRQRADEDGEGVKRGGRPGRRLESNAPHRNEPLDIERSFLVVPSFACQWRRPASTARRTDEAERRGFRDIRFGVRLAIWPASAFTSDSESSRSVDEAPSLTSGPSVCVVKPWPRRRSHVSDGQVNVDETRESSGAWCTTQRSLFRERPRGPSRMCKKERGLRDCKSRKTTRKGCDRSEARASVAINDGWERTLRCRLASHGAFSGAAAIQCSEELSLG